MSDASSPSALLDHLGTAQACAETARAAAEHSATRRLYTRCAWEALARATRGAPSADLAPAVLADIAMRREAVERLLWSLGRPE